METIMNGVFVVALLIGAAFFAYMSSVMVSEQKEKRNAKSRKEKVPVHKKGKSGSKKSKKAKK